ncbi:MAG: hypothetical protein JST92_04520 [Deltaproteobacteria bacterium]|nr:hypothetical protein [Deltaproteobacteria bacterium]
MDPKVVGELIPIVGMISVFSVPVLIVYFTQYFKFKNRELDAELASRKMLSERDREYLEARIERIEQVLMRAPASAPLPVQVANPGMQSPAMLQNPGLFEPPPVPEHVEPGMGQPKKDPTQG